VLWSAGSSLSLTYAFAAQRALQERESFLHQNTLVLPWSFARHASVYVYSLITALQV
jgi:hypothetical protein